MSRYEFILYIVFEMFKLSNECLLSDENNIKYANNIELNIYELKKVNIIQIDESYNSIRKLKCERQLVRSILYL